MYIFFHGDALIVISPVLRYIINMNARAKKSLRVFAVLLLTAAVMGVFCACTRQTSSEWVAQIIEENYYLPVTVTDASELTPQELTAKYLDKYSVYYTAEEYQELLYGEAGNSVNFGCGFFYYQGRLLIMECVANSPAWQQGLRPGDEIVSAVINGETVLIDGEQAYAKFAQAAQNGGISSFTAASGVSVEVSAVEAYKTSYVFMATNSTGISFTYNGLTMTENKGDAIPFLPDGTAYLRLTAFEGDAAEQFRFAVRKFNSLGCDALILDLRCNGGGSTDVTAKIGGCFAAAAGKTLLSATGRIVDSSLACEKFEARDTMPADTEIYVMTNMGTASASEALIGALISYGALTYEDVFISSYTADFTQAFGIDASASGKTYGKGCMQYVIPNERTGEALRLTVALIYWPNGKCVNDAPLSAADGCTLLSAPYYTNAANEELAQLAQIVEQRELAAAA